MKDQVLWYFKWFLNISERGILMLVWMYENDLLCAPARLALEAVEAMADD